MKPLGSHSKNNYIATSIEEGTKNSNLHFIGVSIIENLVIKFFKKSNTSEDHTKLSKIFSWKLLYLKGIDWSTKDYLIYDCERHYCWIRGYLHIYSVCVCVCNGHVLFN